LFWTLEELGVIGPVFGFVAALIPTTGFVRFVSLSEFRAAFEAILSAICESFWMLIYGTSCFLPTASFLDFD
jgi:hypothetical protein